MNSEPTPITPFLTQEGTAAASQAQNQVKVAHDRSKQMWLDMVVCPSCGWAGGLSELRKGRCPNCLAENNEDPFRLLTLAEMIAEPGHVIVDINFSSFIRSILRLAGWNIEVKPMPYPTETEALRTAWLALPDETKAATLAVMRNKDPFASAAADLLAAITKT